MEWIKLLSRNPRSRESKLTIHRIWILRLFNTKSIHKMLRWLYCLAIIGCNFVFNDLLHHTLISNNGPWFTFPFMHIWWHYDDIVRFEGKSYFLIIPCFLKKWNHLSNLNFASSISMIISKINYVSFWRLQLLFSSYRSFYQIKGTLYKHFE